jgi:sarcosine oxidase, subunit gamma
MRSRMLEQRTIVRILSWDSRAVMPAVVNDMGSVAWPRNTGPVARGRVDILCTGPADWLVLGVDQDARDLAPWLAEVFEGSTFRMTDLSQALARIEIDGPEVRDLLAKACSLDLHPPRFPAGHSARTRFAGMPIIVRCHCDSVFECIVPRSYADHCLLWLDDAAIEFSNTAETG